MKPIPAPAQAVYVYEFPVRLWHWTMAACIFTLFATGYFIAYPPQSLTGDPARLYYFGYIIRAHYMAALILCVAMLCRILWAFFGNDISRQIFILSIWKKAWWRGLLDDIKWYLFIKKSPDIHMGHNPLAQVGMFGCVLVILFMCFTGVGIYQAKGSAQFFQAFAFMENLIYALGGNGLDLVVCHRLGMAVLAAFVLLHLYMVVRESIMGRTTMISAMVNGYRMVRGNSLSVRQYEQKAKTGNLS